MYNIMPFYLDLNWDSVNQQEEHNVWILHRQPTVPITGYLILRTSIPLFPHAREKRIAGSNRKVNQSCKPPWKYDL